MALWCVVCLFHPDDPTWTWTIMCLLHVFVDFELIQWRNILCIFQTNSMKKYFVAYSSSSIFVAYSSSSVFVLIKTWFLGHVTTLMFLWFVKQIFLQSFCSQCAFFFQDSGLCTVSTTCSDGQGEMDRFRFLPPTMKFAKGVLHFTAMFSKT